MWYVEYTVTPYAGANSYNSSVPLEGLESLQDRDTAMVRAGDLMAGIKKEKKGASDGELVWREKLNR